MGVGTSSYVEPTTTGMGYYGTEGATIRIEPSGKVNVYIAGGATGNSLETTAVQLTADALGVDLDDVNTIQGDTALTPFGLGTGGSRSGSMIAGAIAATASTLRERIVAIAAHRLEAAPEDIELAHEPRDGAGHARHRPLARRDRHHRLPRRGVVALRCASRARSERPLPRRSARHLGQCHPRLHLRGRRHDRRRHAAALHRQRGLGPMINPNVVEGQIDGGTVQGIGGALLEHLAYDPDGNPVAATFIDYLMPTIADVPVIEHCHIETPGPGPGGYKGVGEGGAIGAPPAVVNAVADALSPFGVDITRLPVTPPAVLALIEAAKEQVDT